jgi:hypothetical protein
METKSFHGVHPLLIAKSPEDKPLVEREAGRIVLLVDGVRRELPPADVASLAAGLGEALENRREYNPYRP